MEHINLHSYCPAIFHYMYKLLDNMFTSWYTASKLVNMNRSGELGVMLRFSRRRGEIPEGDIRTMWRCVLMRYRDQKSVNQIHGEVGLPRAKVSEILEDALRIGMVKLEFEPPRLFQLETDLIDQFGLKDAIVVEAGRSASFTIRDVGRAAAPYIEGVLEELVIKRLEQTAEKREPVRVGLACGRTLLEVVEALRPAYFSEDNLREVGLEIYPLNVADTAIFAAQFPNLIVSAVKAKWSSDKVTAYNLQVRHIENDLSTEEDKLKCLEEHGIRHLFENAAKADLFVIGIGAFKDINPGFRKILQEKGIDQTKLEQLAEGEINYQPFNARRFLDIKDLPEIHTRLITVSRLTLKKAAEQPDKYVIAVACGSDKIDAIRASLTRNNLCYNILVTDDVVASALLYK